MTDIEVTDAARVKRTMLDHGRMLWLDDIEGHCDTPELCSENAPVRCSPCAIKQSTAAGINSLNQERSYSPEVCRLKREIEALQKQIDEAREESQLGPFDIHTSPIERNVLVRGFHEDADDDMEPQWFVGFRTDVQPHLWWIAGTMQNIEAADLWAPLPEAITRIDALTDKGESA